MQLILSSAQEVIYINVKVAISPLTQSHTFSRVLIRLHKWRMVLIYQIDFKTIHFKA